jgi:uncharacterized repeat protein (TIGR02059 family)
MFAFKKIILLLVFFAITTLVSGTTYYVSSAGNDAANGLTESTSWKSITKVNSIKFAAGDNIYFKRGDIWYETLVPSTSGNSSARITFRAYGTGANPVISGFATLTGWTDAGGGVYSKAVSWQSNPNVLIFDDINQPLGRYPHLTSIWGWPSSIWTASSATRTSITSSSIPSPGTINFNSNGAQVVMRSAGATNDRCTITGHSGTTINFTSTACDTPPAGAGFFIQNHPACLTTLGDWRYESGTIYMYFGSDKPTNHTIKVSTLDKIVDLSNSKSYVTLDGLTIEGGNSRNIDISGGSHLTIQNSTIRFGGGYGIYCNNSSYPLIDANTIDNNNNSGISLSSPYYTITNNTITNSGMILGMGVSGWTVNVGINAQGGNGLVSYNRIINCGYDGINWGGAPTEISYNFIDYTCMNATDGACIYSYRGTGAGRVEKYNICMHSKSQLYGWIEQDWGTGSGIYLDGDGGVSVQHNICAYNEGKGLFLNADNTVTAQYNTCYANIIGLEITSEANTIGIGPPNRDGRARSHVVDHNIFISQIAAQLCAVFQTYTLRSDISLFGTIDYNIYGRPTSNSNYIQSWENGYNNQRLYDLTGWKANGLGQDANSTVSPVTLTDVNKIRFEYNDTKINKVIALDAGYVDAVGTKYSGSITLLPFTSVVLMADPNSSASSASPVGPLYVSSVIENITPSTLEITYDETLDLSVPSASAFVVMVNGVKRNVTSVSISGNNVLLTLASPVVYGDVITVSYIKPSSNQLKKTSGELAVSFSSPQPVTNNCLSLANNSAKKSTINIYPNPARDYINISFHEQEISLESQILRIFDLSGKLCLESILNSGNNNYHVLFNLKSGIYIVQIVSGSIINFVQKLIVN